MKKLNIVTLAILCMCNRIQADDTIKSPTMTPAIHLDPKEWKLYHKKTATGVGYCEWIPSNQTSDKHSTIIRIGYFDISNQPKNYTLDTFYKSVMRLFIGVYQGTEISVGKIEQTESDLIFEFRSHTAHIITPEQTPIPYKPGGKLFPQHEINLALLRDHGNARYIYCIGYIKMHDPVDSEERAKWIKILKEQTVFQTLENASKDKESLSLVSLT